MGASESAVRKASGRVEWMHDANVEPVAWHHYSDVENLIIEEAFVAEQTQAMFDGYHIDFQRSVQISNCDASEERPVKRMVRDRNELHLREDRFTTNPIAPDPPFGVQYGFVSPFIKEVLKQLDLTRDRLPSKDKTTVTMVLDKAVLGIIEEGGKQGRQCEAEYIGDLLRANRRKGIKTIWKCCAHLYSLDSFLHKTLNDTMRLIGSPEHEEIWRCKLPTLGPFCLLLWDNPHNKTMIRPGTILYRGMKLSDDIITSFKDESLRSSKLWHTFQAFTSCSRNRTFAEQFGNVLFIMKTLIAFTIDLSPLSEYGFEEEELLYPAVSFTVDRVESSDSNDKHVVYVTLQHKHRKINHPRLNQVVPQTTQQEQNSHTTDSPNPIDQPLPQPDPVQHRARENGLYSLDSFLTSSLTLNATLDVRSFSLQKLNEAFVGLICLVCNVE